MASNYPTRKSIQTSKTESRLSRQTEINTGISAERRGLWELPISTERRGLTEMPRMGLELLEPRLLMSVSLDGQGWTEVLHDAGSDARVIYVSSSQGSDSNSGLASGQAVRTLAKATSLVRNGSDDWLLLNRGDNWDETLNLYFSGNSTQQPIYVSTYGSDADRPTVDRIKVGGNYQAIVGIAVDGPGKYATPLDGGVEMYNYQHDVLIEDVYIEGVKIGIDIRHVSNVTVRRSAILDSAKLGMFIEYVDDLIVEESILDNNGVDHVLEHNIYKSRGGERMIFRNNFLTRGANDGLKMRADTGDIQIYGNVFSYNSQDIGGKLDLDDVRAGRTDWELSNIDIIGNVFLDTGFDTHQSAIYMANTRDLTIADNYFSNSNTAPWTATIWLDGHAPEADTAIYNVQIIGNTISNVKSEGIRLAVSISGQATIAGNTIMMAYNDTHNTEIIAAGSGNMGIDYSDNTYYSEFNTNRWFKLDGNKVSFAEWQAASGDTSTIKQVDFVDDTRTLSTYNQTLGGANDGIEFINVRREMSKQNWNINYTSDVVVDYIAEGLTPTDGAGPDVSKPTATLIADDVAAAGGLSYEFSVFFNDNKGIDVSDLVDNNTAILITGPGGFNQYATYVDIDNETDGRPRTATYQITAPGGNWDFADSGVYTATIQAGQVTDTSENAVSAGAIGTFSVNIVNPNAATVRVTTNDATASESAQDPATFVIERLSGSGELTVNYSLSGDAVNGTDYALLTGTAVIADGQDSVTVTVIPVDDNAAEGNEIVTLTIDNSNDYDVTGSPASVDISDNDADASDQLELISEGSTWRYLDDGSDQGSTWTQLGYDDSAWATGLARLGYGGDGEVTTVDYGVDANNRNITTYFRRSFNLDDSAAVNDLTLRLLRDDGAVVYLNGVEVFRDNMPDGAIDFETLASEGLFGEDETTFLESLIAIDALVDGENVLTVEIHQNRVNSSDLSFDLELIADVAAGNGGGDDDVTPPVVAASAISNITAAGSTHQFAVIYSDNVAIDLTTIGSNDVLVTGPNNYSQAASVVGVVENGTSQMVTYQITAPDGNWKFDDNGTYAVTLQANAVQDTSALAVTGGQLGTFDVAIVSTDTTAPTADATAEDITGNDNGVHRFTVTFTDNDKIDYESLDSTDVIVRTPDNETLTVTLISVDSPTDGSPRIATYEVTAPGGSWAELGNGTYNIRMQSNEVTDLSGNAVPADIIGSFTVDIPVIAAPTAITVPSAIDHAGGMTYTFIVTYSGDAAIDDTTFGDNNILISNADGFVQTATMVAAGNGADPTSRSVFYQINAPGGSWDLSDNGDYTVSVIADTVYDVAGNAVANGEIGNFQVVITDENAPLVELTEIIDDSAVNHVLVVTYNDDVQIDLSSIDSSDLLISGPNAFSQTAALIPDTAVVSDAGRQVTVSYRVSAPDGNWDFLDNGTYTVSLQAGQVADTSGNFTDGQSLGQFNVDVADNVMPAAEFAEGIDEDEDGNPILTVVYSDDSGIILQSINDFDIKVTGQAGFNRFAELIQVNSINDGKVVFAAYRLTNPYGQWEAADNGSYAVSVTVDQVSDLAGNKVAGGQIGTFIVNIKQEQQRIDENIEPTFNGSVTISPEDFKTVSWTDADGTVATLSLGVGTALVEFTGDNMDWILAGTKATITGENVRVTDVTLSNTTDRSSLTVKAKGGDKFVSIDNFTADSAMKQISAKVVDLLGSVDIAGALGKLELHNITAAQIQIGDSDNLKDTFTLIASSVTDSSLSSEIDIKSITAVQWLDTDDQADVIVADSLGSLSIKGDKRNEIAGNFQADLQLPGNAELRNVIKSVKIAGEISDSNWQVQGQVGSITAGAITDWTAVFDSAVKSIKVKGDFDNSGIDAAFSALSIGSLSVGGNMIDVDLSIAQAIDAKLLALKSASVKGSIDGGVWDIAGNVGTIKADSIASQWSGVIDGQIRSITTKGDFDGDLTALSAGSLSIGGNLISAQLTLTQPDEYRTTGLKSLKVKGDVTGGGWDIEGHVGSIAVNSTDAAWSADIEGNVKSMKVATDMAGSVAANSLGSLSVRGDMNAVDLTLAQEVTPKIAAIKSIKVTGDVTGGQWDIEGNVGSVSVGSTDAAWSADIEGNVKSMKVGADMAGSVAAQSLGGLSVRGDMNNVSLTMTQAIDPKIAGLKSAKVTGDVIGGTWDIEGNTGSISLGSTDAAWSADIEGSVKSLRVNANMAGQLDALSVGSLSVRGDMLGVDMTLTQAIDARIMATKSVSVTGQIVGGQWTIAGSVGSIKAGDMLEGIDINIAGDVKSITSKLNLNADLTARSIKSLAVKGDITDSNITVTGQIDPENAKQQSLGKMTVGGWFTGSIVDSQGHIGRVTVGGINDSSLLAGVADAVDGLPDDLGDFDVLATIGSFTQKGIRGQDVSFIDSNIAAYTISKVSIKDVQTENAGQSFGITADEIGSYTRASDNGSIKFKALADTDIAEDDDDYILRVI